MTTLELSTEELKIVWEALTLYADHVLMDAVPDGGGGFSDVWEEQAYAMALDLRNRL